MANTTAARTKSTSTRSPRRGYFCNHCKKDGLLRSELSGAWLCAKCDQLGGIRGHMGKLSQATKDRSAEYWEETKGQLNVIVDDEGGERFNVIVDDGPEAAAPPQLNNKHRRYLEWTVAQSSLPAAQRQTLRAVLLHQGAEGRPGKLADKPCRAGYATLAREAGLSQSRFRALLRTLARAGHVYRTGGPRARETHVTMCYEAESLKPLHALWKGSVGEAVAGDREPVNRFFWLRGLVRNRVLRHVPKRTVVIGVAMVVDLLVNSHGRPHRWITLAEIAKLVGYSPQCVRWALSTLESALGVVEIVRRDGPRGGLLIFLLGKLETK